MSVQTQPIDDTGTAEAAEAVKASAVMERGRAAAARWSALTVEARAEALRPLAREIAARRDEIARRICEENGKPFAEAMGQEVVTSIQLVVAATEAAPRVLAPRPVRSTWQPHRKMAVHRRPFGVIVVIAPWNIPLYIPLSQVVHALLAGNAVVLKPSELTPRCGDLLAELLRACPLPPGLVQVVHGDGAVGAALVAAHPDKVSFTGSVATGRRVMAACAAYPIPVTLELGGVDAMIVRADADLELAASAAAWGATFNGGQACCSVERLLVHRSVYDAFTARLADRLDRIDRRSDLGPAIDDRQLAVWTRHLDDARQRGLRVRGGEVLGPRRLAPALVDGPGLDGPGVADAACWREETFGPVVAAMPFGEDHEAVELHNANPCGLTASVFTADIAAGQALAVRLRAGAVAVNEVAATVYATPELPWGGVGASGFGRSHGDEGLLEGTWAQVIDLPRTATQPKRPWWYPYDEEQARALGLLGEAMAAEGPARRARALLRAGRAFARLLSRAPRL